MALDLDLAKNIIKEAEGYKPHVYIDTQGRPTTGYGHKLTKSERESLNLNDYYLGEAKTNFEKLPKIYLSSGPNDVAFHENNFEKDFNTAKENAMGNFTRIDNLQPELSSRLISMAYQLGDRGQEKFDSMMRAYEAGDYIKAAENVVSNFNSQTGNRVGSTDWHKQTPGRAEALEQAFIDQAMATQEFPTVDITPPVPSPRRSTVANTTTNVVTPEPEPEIAASVPEVAPEVPSFQPDPVISYDQGYGYSPLIPNFLEEMLGIMPEGEKVETFVPNPNTYMPPQYADGISSVPFGQLSEEDQQREMIRQLQMITAQERANEKYGRDGDDLGREVPMVPTEPVSEEPFFKFGGFYPENMLTDFKKTVPPVEEEPVPLYEEFGSTEPKEVIPLQEEFGGTPPSTEGNTVTWNGNIYEERNGILFSASTGIRAPEPVQIGYQSSLQGTEAPVDESFIPKPYEIKTLDQVESELAVVTQKAQEEVNTTGSLSDETATELAQKQAEVVQTETITSNEAAESQAVYDERIAELRNRYDEEVSQLENQGLVPPTFEEWMSKQGIEIEEPEVNDSSGLTVSQDKIADGTYTFGQAVAEAEAELKTETDNASSDDNKAVASAKQTIDTLTDDPNKTVEDKIKFFDAFKNEVKFMFSGGAIANAIVGYAGTLLFGGSYAQAGKAAAQMWGAYNKQKKTSNLEITKARSTAMSERQKLAEKYIKEGFTPESAAQFIVTGNPAVLVRDPNSPSKTSGKFAGASQASVFGQVHNLVNLGDNSQVIVVDNRLLSKLNEIQPDKYEIGDQIPINAEVLTKAGRIAAIPDDASYDKLQTRFENVAKEINFNDEAENKKAIQGWSPTGVSIKATNAMKRMSEFYGVPITAFGAVEEQIGEAIKAYHRDIQSGLIQPDSSIEPYISDRILKIDNSGVDSANIVVKVDTDGNLSNDGKVQPLLRDGKPVKYNSNLLTEGSSVKGLHELHELMRRKNVDSKGKRVPLTTEMKQQELMAAQYAYLMLSKDKQDKYISKGQGQKGRERSGFAQFMFEMLNKE